MTVEKVALTRQSNGGENEYKKLKDKIAAGLKPSQKASLGCVLGAFIGDSLGSYLEFERGVMPPDAVEEGMEMPGRGTWKLAPGQVTDDCELAMCLLNALNEGNSKLDLKVTCKWYAKWMKSSPFDVGGTTKNGLQGCNE